MAKASTSGVQDARADAKSNAKSGGPGDTEVVRELAEILADTGLTEIEVERGDGLRVRVAREVSGVVQATTIAPAPITTAAPALQSAAPESPARTDAADPGAHPGAVTSPMVGTAYLAPEPGAPTFVTAGQSVKAGDTLLLIEAMKTFNPIKAPKAGKVLEILVTEAQPVEFGETLVIVG